MPPPISDLPALLRHMQPERHAGAYVFATVPALDAIDTEAVLASVREETGISVIVTDAYARQHGLPIDFLAAWITLRVHSDLAAVGLTAAVAAALAATGISCNVVAGHRHDHLFVPWPRADEAMQALRRLQESADA